MRWSLALLVFLGCVMPVCVQVSPTAQGWYRVLSDEDSAAIILDLTVWAKQQGVRNRGIPAGCKGQVLVIEELESVGDSAMVYLGLNFSVHGLPMGRESGKAVVSVNDQIVGTCHFQLCSVLIPRNVFKDEEQHVHNVRVSLQTTEPVLSQHPLDLLTGVQESLLISFDDEAEQGTRAELSSTADAGGPDGVRASLCGGEHAHTRFGQGRACLGNGVQCTGASGLSHEAVGGEADMIEGANGIEKFGGEGESSERQRGFFTGVLLEHPHIRRVLEVGFHTGGSARAFLLARRDVSVTSFDLARHGHEEAFWHFTRQRFPGRHTLVVGDSQVALPAYAAANPLERYGLFFIDGLHTEEGALRDVRNAVALAEDGALVLMDDYAPWVYWGEGPYKAWHRAQEEGLIEHISIYQELPGAFAPRWEELAAGDFEALAAKLKGEVKDSTHPYWDRKVWVLGRFREAESRRSLPQRHVVWAQSALTEEDECSTGCRRTR